MSRIECSKCGDLIEVTASTVVLPFTCMKCEECEAVPNEFAGQVYDDMAPTNTETLTDEFATVENTTALIADLEKQLADTKASLVEERKYKLDSRVLVTRIMVLENQLNAAQARAETLTVRGNYQTALIADLEKQLAQTKAFLDGRDRESTVLLARLAEKTKELSISKDAAAYWRDTYWYEHNELNRERDKGFWAYISEVLIKSRRWSN